MKRVCLLILISLGLLATPALADRRVALVMGNSAYRHATQLPNPAGDAEAIADLLKSLGFEVVLGTNLGREAMTEKLGEFARASGGADVALFFYAGHGMQLGGKNLLIPIDAELKSEFDAKVRTIEIDSVLQDTMADAKVKLVLLDACRDNPFAAKIVASAPKTRSVVVGAGLAEMRPGEGTLIAFATGPGQVAADGEAKHSPFTRALLTHLGQPGMEIRLALTRVRAQVTEETRKRQLPWENTNLTGFFYMANAPATGNTGMQLASGPSTGNGAGPAASNGPDSRAALELELWNSVKNSKSADEYKAYLEKYPNGTFSDLARSRIAALKTANVRGAGAGGSATGGEIRTAEASADTEDALSLSQDSWREIQARLSALGFGSRTVDGKVRDSTRQAIIAWQTARGYPATGYFNQMQRTALLKERVPANTAAKATPSTRSSGDSGAAAASAPRTSQGSPTSSAPQPTPGEVGEFVGGFVRGSSRGRLPF